MSRFVKNEKGYEKSFKADWMAIKKGLKKARAKTGKLKKVTTSISLDVGADCGPFVAVCGPDTTSICFPISFSSIESNACFFSLRK